jgi:hypothetical protein
MAEDPEKALLHHANQQFFAAIELASQKETHKAIQEFEKAITLFNLLSAKCSEELREWCSIAIDEATSQKLHLELNEMEEIPETLSPEEKKAVAEEPGAIFRVVCSLELVSCFLLSRDRPEELITDGSTNPIRLCISNDEIRSPSTAESGENVSKPPQAFLQITPSLPYPLGTDVPCLRVQPGYFVLMLPEQKYYGIVFPEGYPEDALATWENELAKYCVLCAEDEDGNISPILPQNAESAVQVAQMAKPAAEEAPSGPLHSLARGITTGAEYVTWGIRSTSEYLRHGIERTGGAISQQVHRPDAQTKVPAPIEASVGFVKTITPGLVYVSGGAAATLASIAGYIGSSVGSILPTNTGNGGHGRFGFRATGAASMKAAWDVWSELAGVGQNLIDGTQKASVQVIKARYGEHAGKFTHDLIGIGSDIYKVNKHIHSFGIKSLAKGSIKAAGTAAVKSHVEAKKGAKAAIEGGKDIARSMSLPSSRVSTPIAVSIEPTSKTRGPTPIAGTSASYLSGALKRDKLPPKPSTKLLEQ